MASLGWMLPGWQAEETGEEQSGPLLCPPPLNKEGTVFTPSRKSSTFLLLTCHSPRISRRFFYPMIDGYVHPSTALVTAGRSWTWPCSPAAFGGVLEGGNLQNALASWESSFHTQKTYHPTLLAGFQSLMTFVNHQPVCLHQQTLPTGTPFNTKAVAIPFKRGSLKAPLCSREENKISSLQNFKPLDIM